MIQSAPLQPDKPFGHFSPRGLTAVVLAICAGLPSRWPGAHALNKLLRAPLKRGPATQFDVAIDGLKLRLRNRGNYCELRQLFEPQFFDVAEIDWLAREMSEGGCFVDIGGNIGLYSLHVAQRSPAGTRVVAVEPDPALGQRMRFNAASNDLDIELAAVALSDYAGTGTLTLGAHQSGQNALDTGSDGIEVPVITLMSLCQQQSIEHIRAMKIDIEGHEDRVLRSFFDTAPESLWPQALVIEHTHDDTHITHRLQSELGYRQVARTRRNLLLKRAPAA